MSSRAEGMVNLLGCTAGWSGLRGCLTATTDLDTAKKDGPLPLLCFINIEILKVSVNCIWAIHHGQWTVQDGLLSVPWCHWFSMAVLGHKSWGDAIVCMHRTYECTRVTLPNGQFEYLNRGSTQMMMATLADPVHCGRWRKTGLCWPFLWALRVCKTRGPSPQGVVKIASKQTECVIERGKVETE